MKYDAPWYVGANGATVATRVEAQRFARDLVLSDDYQKNLRVRLLAGTLPAAVEVLLLHYAFGKPLEQVQVQVSSQQQDLSQLSGEELLRRMDEMQAALRDLQELEEAIPARYKVA